MTTTERTDELGRVGQGIRSGAVAGLLLALAYALVGIVVLLLTDLPSMLGDFANVLRVALLIVLAAGGVGIVLGGLTGSVIALALNGLDATMGGWAWVVGLFASGGLAAGVHLLLPSLVGPVSAEFVPLYLLVVGVPTLVYVVAGALLARRFYRRWYRDVR